MSRTRVIAVALPVLCIAVFAMLPAGAAPAPERSKAPHIKHYFVIVLENKNFEETFGQDSKAPYLAKTLRAKGAFLSHYYAIGHLSLDNYIAMVSGQAPNPQTQADCPFFTNFAPGTPTSDGQVVGQGCVYPPGTVQTVANQLEGAGYTWKGYMEDMAAGQPTSCRHPAIGAQDTTQSAEVGDQYATRHNPFVYFHSIIDYPTCDKNDVDLKELPKALQRESTTPNYSFITPNLCHDGHDEPCVDDQPGGLVSIDKFLREWVPRILRSPGYKDRGLLLITFDEAEATGSHGDASACCNEQPGPNTPNPGALITGPGGGRVGAVALSPCTRPGTLSDVPYNHYSQLRWVEDNFGLPHLGYAGQAGLVPFGGDFLNQPLCGQKVNLGLRPQVARTGERTAFHFSARSPLDQCRRAVEIHFGGKIAHTHGNGKATIKRRFARPGTRVARASKPGCAPDHAKVHVLPAR
jgi:hypothetical protein